jgi:AraC family transcriptional regulator
MQLGPGEYFGSTSQELKSERLTVSATRYEPLQEQPWHVHENPTFFVQLVGDHIDGAPSGDRLQPALSATYHPTTAPHRSRIGPRGMYGINLEVCPEWLASHGLETGMLGDQRIEGSPPVAHLSLLLLGACAGGSQGELDELALELIGHFVQTENKPTRTKWLNEARERLRAEFRDPLSLRSLAREAGVHPVYFARAFRGQFGCSVTECVQRLRLQAAADMVLSGVPVGQAALEAGFSDQFHFSRLLKKHYRLTPKQVRNLGRSGLA